MVKQDLDFSCGVASIATLLNGYYNQKVTEEEVLKIMDKGDLMASFDDMQKALNKLGVVFQKVC
ncbi:cysteine peptidase family C39 domain-containing protein [Acinetobacter junii]|uniref:cysteine peptidase family C39 domain-containing protein n=1 Tax=Acinetobacter junii TaxID=40215 RepID=UPI003C7BD103